MLAITQEMPLALIAIGACSLELPDVYKRQGNMTAETPYAGVFVKKADPMVLKDLDEKGLLLSLIHI